MEVEPIEFFRKEMDVVLDFLFKISKPEYLTREGQEKVDKFLEAINIIDEHYLNQLIKGIK